MKTRTRLSMSVNARIAGNSMQETEKGEMLTALVVLPFRSRRRIQLRTVPVLKVLLTGLLLAGGCFAQGGITANGQIHLPSGRPARQEIRLHVQLESARRAPYLVYTDSMGRFELRDLRALVNYKITVETDDLTWATTTVDFIPSGLSPRLDIFLQPLRKEASSHTAESVSASSLNQRIPPAAAKAFESALKLIRKNEHAPARPHLDRAILIFPQYVTARNELAVLLMRENKLDEAEANLRAALEVDPVALRPMMNLGLCLSRAERFADALPVMEKAMQLAPTDASGYLLLGVAQLKTGNGNGAESSLKKAYELGGKKLAPAQYYLAVLYIQRNDSVHAAEALETYLRDNPNDPNAPMFRRTLEQLRTPKP